MAKEQEIENRIKQDEQEKAIENLENLSEYGLCYTITEKIQEDIKTVLNMLKEKDKEIEKKDKIIDLMAEQLAGLAIWDNEKEEPLILKDKEEVKQYFERKK